jgi:hypothetical protein
VVLGGKSCGAHVSVVCASTFTELSRMYYAAHCCFRISDACDDVVIFVVTGCCSELVTIVAVVIGVVIIIIAIGTICSSRNAGAKSHDVMAFENVLVIMPID